MSAAKPSRIKTGRDGKGGRERENGRGEGGRKRGEGQGKYKGGFASANEETF